MKNWMYDHIKTDLLKDIKELVSIASLPEEETSKEGAPFGAPIKECFETFRIIAKRMGFVVEDDNGYAISASLGEGEDYIGVLGHLDVVDAGDESLWDSAPYEMLEKDGILYGRGVNDDKGPLMAALYAAWLLKQQHLPLRYPIRIIAGGAEETTWECMKHYFTSHKQPICGFSPDGNFPIVNGEKGILQVRFLFPTSNHWKISSKERLNFVCDELHVIAEDDKETIYTGNTSLSRNPQRGDNSIFTFVKNCSQNIEDGSMKACVNMINEQFCDDFYGKKSGLYAEDKEMGTTSICLMSLTCNSDVFELCVDIRYVKTISYDTIINRLQEIASQYGAQLDVIKEKRMLFVDEQSELIQSLKTAYKKVMHEDAPVLTKGGASYARVLDCGVAFGATFPDEDPKPHMPNECMPVTSLLKACEIYYEALYELAVDKTKL